LGGAGSVACEVGTAQIAQFFMCLAHQLKQADYKKMVAMMPERAFTVFNQILYLQLAAGSKIESFVGVEILGINKNYNDVVRAAKQGGQQLIKKIEEQLKSGWGWFSYMPPESRGALIGSITDVFRQPQYGNDYDLQKIGAFCINELLSTIQSSRQLANTLERISPDLGTETGRNHGVQLISSVVNGTKFSNCIDRCETQLAQAAPLLGRGFLRNDEPAFSIAQFPLHHPGYALA
jgi:hypothetical protein